MEIANVVIFVAEDCSIARNVFGQIFNKNFEDEIKTKFSVDCKVKLMECIDSAVAEIKERHQNTKTEKRCYLSVGVFDLVNFCYPERKIKNRGEVDYKNPIWPYQFLRMNLFPFSTPIVLGLS